MVWYPSVPVDDQSGRIVEDAPPDLTYAPYPIILSSAKSGGHFAPHLVSYGFVVVGIKNLDTYEPWDQNLIDQPLDILFALHQVAAGALDGLEDMIDADRAGVLGYSIDGYNSLALSGARIDPKFYLEQCANAFLQLDTGTAGAGNTDVARFGDLPCAALCSIPAGARDTGAGA